MLDRSHSSSHLQNSRLHSQVSTTLEDFSAVSCCCKTGNLQTMSLFRLLLIRMWIPILVWLTIPLNQLSTNSAQFVGNLARLLVTSVMLAVKFFDDVYYSNAYYAKVWTSVGLRDANLQKTHQLG